MRNLISGTRRRHLAQVALICLTGSFLAGCSSDFTRFDRTLYSAVPTAEEARGQAAVNPYPGDVDSTTTASIQGPVPHPASNIAMANGQPDHAGYPQAVYQPQPLAQSQTGQPAWPSQTATPSASSGIVKAELPKPASTPSRPAAAPASVPAPDPVRTASVAIPKPTPVAAPVAAVSSEGNGWTRTGGTAITLKDGETLYNLSKRYGVPVKEIMRANSISDANAIQSGQTIVIPTFVYSRSAPVSAPDSDKGTQAARASTGTVHDSRPVGDQAALTSQDLQEKDAPRSKPKQRAIDTDSEENPPDYSIVTSSVSSTPSTTGHTVQSGDTLSRIASKYGVTTAALRSANGLNSDMIRIGQVLTIPQAGASSATIAAASPQGVDPIVTGSTGKVQGPQPAPDQPKPYVKPKTEDSIITGSVDAKAPEATGIGTFRWPVNGRVIAGFGAKKGSEANDGIDISVPEGTAVKAAENGVVIYSGNELEGFGNLILVRHSNGYVSAYAHNRENEVKKGDQVRRGQVIARSGRTGNAPAPMLHFELRKDSKPVNPVDYLGS